MVDHHNVKTAYLGATVIKTCSRLLSHYFKVKIALSSYNTYSYNTFTHNISHFLGDKLKYRKVFLPSSKY